MSLQVLVVLVGILLLVAVLGVVIRTRGRDQTTSTAAEARAEPGSEGMHVVADGEISPGPRNDDDSWKPPESLGGFP